jgi:hypothetical protein
MLFRTMLASLVIAGLGLSTFGSPALAQGPTVATVTGTALDGQGNGLGGVAIAMTGPATYVTKTANDGSYRIDNVKPGIYRVSATLGGYEAARQDNFAVVGGSTQSLNVTLLQETLTSLQEIGRVRVNSSNSTFNASPASITIIPGATFQEQGSLGLQRVLEETPGFYLPASAAGGNTAGRAAYTVPSIRLGFVTETADLLDGHPVGAGDNGATTIFSVLESYVVGSVEVIKGPGATAPEIYSAINGTVNVHTLDPTSRPLGSITFGYDGYGGQFSNYRLTGTTMHGKLGYALDYVIDGTNGPLEGIKLMPTTIPAANNLINGSTFTATTNGAPTNNIENNPTAVTSTLLACCYGISTLYLNRNELVKLRFNFSANTALTASFLGEQEVTGADGNANTFFPTQFIPGASYASATNGFVPNTNITTVQQIATAMETPGELLNRVQPTYQFELRTGNATNNILARYWQSQYEFFVNQGGSTDQPDQSWVTNLNLYGTVTTPSGVKTFTGQSTPVTFQATNGLCAGPTPGTYIGASATPGAFNQCGTATSPFINYATPAFYNTTQYDHMHGGTFEYDHFFDNGDVATLSYDQTQHSGYLSGTWQPPVVPGVPVGAWINTQTILARGILTFGKLNATLANYYNFYRTNYSTNFSIPVPVPNGLTGVVSNGAFSIANPTPTFQQSFTSHEDGRIGLTYRADPNLSLRGSAGTAIVPVFLSAIDVSNTLPVLAATGLNYTNTAASTGLRPETAFGFDIGLDWRMGDGQTVLSSDVYRENLRDQIFTAESINCYTASTATISPTTAGTCATPALPLFTTTNTNFGTTRYEGFELSIARDPAVGFGWRAQGSLMRGYAYHVNPCYYYTAPNATCTGTIGTNNPIPTNLAAIGVINNVNFQPLGSAGLAGLPLTGNFLSAAAGASAAPGPGGVLGGGFPYSQGFAEIHWRTPRGAFAQLSTTYWGPNNGYNMPAFFRYDANATIPLWDTNTKLTANLINLGNIDNAPVWSIEQGVTFPLLNNRIGLSNIYPIGPRRVNISITHNFDWGK